MLPYAFTIFSGAFLLFQVQPLIGKYILPWFGGGPGVWTTCLLFFQTVLLGGYAYAHLSSTRLKPKMQAAVHLGLLVLALALLPVTPSESWKLRLGGDPVAQILLLLTACVGLPYFVLSATGPLVQQWFSRAQPGVSPYRLYALSNLGSLLALLSYPVFFEVKFSRQAQAGLWSAGLAVFVIGCGYCAVRLWRGGRESAAAPAAAVGAESAPRARWGDRSLWLVWPALASVLLLATTNKLCQEVAVVPFLWVGPLALYLLSFIVCFDHARWYRREVFVPLLAVATAIVCDLLSFGGNASMAQQVAGYLLLLFTGCMVAHGELYRLRPAPRELTAYYLHISAGGAIGGFLVAVVAPAVFSEYRELQLGVTALWFALAAVGIRQSSLALVQSAWIGAALATAAVPVLRAYYDDGAGVGGELLAFYRDHLGSILAGLVAFVVCAADVRRWRWEGAWRPRMAAFLMLPACVVAAVFLVEGLPRGNGNVLRASRNFYGTLKVFDYARDEPDEHYRLLMHGATTHGLQFFKPSKAMLPSTYYGEHSGVGLALKHLPRTSGRKLGLVGLGTGTLAAYGRAGDQLRIYEINPAVERLARDPFTHLARSPAKIDVVMGDARLSLERELSTGGPQRFDLLALDAFSGDAIPVHLLTREAVALYLRHLQPDGVLAVHISNRYLNLEPVVRALAQEFGLGLATISDDDEPDWWIYATTWILVTRNRGLLERGEIFDATDLPVPKPPRPVLWTDDHASLFQILK